MLTEICKEIKNWFEKNKFYGKFKIENHTISGDAFTLLDEQYFRIIGSVFNDGVYKNTPEGLSGLKDEEFEGSIWALAIPKDIIDLDGKISNWMAQYGGSNANSPFSSESFGGYSYSKSTGVDANGNSLNGWKLAFADELNRWRKI